MDQSTHEVRNASWKAIISECQNRTDGTTVKQWCTDHGISCKTYYYHLRKFRKEAYETMQNSSSLPAPSGTGQITFAEIPIPASQSPQDQRQRTYQQIHPAAVIQTSRSTIAISHDIPSEILTAILKEVAHA